MPSLNRTGLRNVVLPLVVLVLVSLAFKWVYLRTAESTYNIEELPLPALALAGGSNILADTAASRLYGTTPITTALSLKAFGFTTLGLKFPNIVFFILAVVFLALFSRQLPKLRDSWLWLVPATLLVLGPPVIQIWGMKNRGGFIENIFALVLCLWICARPSGGESLSSFQKFALAIIIGLAAWSQPIALVWGAIVVAYVVWHDLMHARGELPRTALVLLAGLVLGLLPLIHLNFLFNFRTFAVLDGGELLGGVDLGLFGRTREIFISGLPRLLGLKEQWSDAWIVAAPLAWLLYALFVLPAAWAAARAAVEFLRTRKFGLDILLVGVGVAIIGANIVSSWGNFQGEPRRLLMLYVPFAVLTALGLARSRKLLWGYLVIWSAFSLWANVLYIKKNPSGFSHSMYQKLDEVADFLEGYGVKGVYSDVWTGGRVTFASGGRIPWFQSNYDPSGYGYIGDAVLTTHEAMLFNLYTQTGIAARDRFVADAKGAGIDCQMVERQNIAIVFRCSRNVDLRQLPVNAMKRGMRVGDVVIDLEADDPAVRTQVAVGRDGVLVAKGGGGYALYGPYRPLPEGNYRVEVSGVSSRPFTLDVVAGKGEQLLAKLDRDAALDADSRRLAELDFGLDETVSDLEVRIQVQDGSDLQVDGYRIVVR